MRSLLESLFTHQEGCAFTEVKEDNQCFSDEFAHISLLGQQFFFFYGLFRCNHKNIEKYRHKSGII